MYGVNLLKVSGSLVQLDRTTDFYSVCRGFESLRDRQLGVGVGTREPLITALAVDDCSRLGSNPSTPTISQELTYA